MAFSVKKTPSYSGTGGLIMKGEGGKMAIIPSPEGPPPPPPPPISTQNLILYLDASNPASNTGSGTTWFDISGQGNHFTATGSPTRISTHGGGWNVPNGIDGFSSGLNLQGAFPNGLSVGTWVVGTNFATFSAAGIVDRGNWQNTSGWGMFVHSDRDLQGPRSAKAKGSSIVQNNTIYYLVFTLSSGGTAKVFINGVLDGTSNSVALPTAHNSSTFVGRSSDNYSGAFSLKGSIYEVHMYDKGLTDAEVLSNFNGTKTRFGL
jgi:hypothetical protein